MGNIKGDFLGFTFDGVHSTELGVFRVSDGSRYSENLLPTIQDKTIQIPGADGTYYYGSFYTQRQINFSIAYDNLSEAQLRRLKNIFSDKKIHNLIFDELPYKVYKVKITGTPNLKYICFDRPAETDLRDKEIDMGIKDKSGLYGVGARTTSGRVYKGEGQLNFISYTPFAKSRFKYLNQYIIQNIPEWGSMDTNNANDVYYNYYDWAESSRMVSSNTKKKFNGISYVVDVVNTNGVMYHNAGDIKTPFYLSFYFDDVFKGCTVGNTDEQYITLGEFSLYEGDSGFRINTKLHLLEGINENGEITGTIYNKFIEAGDFFEFNPTLELTWLPIYWTNEIPNNFSGKIDYQYLYF